jgi:hypothetical protein
MTVKIDEQEPNHFPSMDSFDARPMALTQKWFWSPGSKRRNTASPGQGAAGKRLTHQTTGSEAEA